MLGDACGFRQTCVAELMVGLEADGVTAQHNAHVTAVALSLDGDGVTPTLDLVPQALSLTHTLALGQVRCFTLFPDSIANPCLILLLVIVVPAVQTDAKQ
jgi:hypothetical protein